MERNLESSSTNLNNVKVLKLTTTTDHDFELTRRGDVINVRGKGIVGHFDVKVRRKLDFCWNCTNPYLFAAMREYISVISYRVVQ